MTRKYKMPRTYKSEETYQRFMESHSKAGKTPKNITPEVRERLQEGGRIGARNRKNKILIVADEKIEYKV